MRSSHAPLVRETYLYRTSLPGARLRAKLRGAKVRDESGAELATVVEAANGGRWVARALGAAGFTAAILVLMGMVGGSDWASWIVGLAVPGFLLTALACVEHLCPEGGYTLLSDAGETLLRIAPETRWGVWRRSGVEDAEGQCLGSLRRSPLRDRFWPLGHAAPLLIIEPLDGASVSARRPSAWAPGWIFECEGRPVARYAIGTRPGSRDRLEVGATAVDPRLLLAAVLMARP